MNCKKTVVSIITLIPMVWMLSHHQTDNFKPSNRIELISVVDILDKEVEKAKREKNREKLELMRAAENKVKDSGDNEDKKQDKIIHTTSRGGVDRGIFTVTCYDLSVQSCGKPVDSKGYGITASGVSLKGHTWETARAIAVDPQVIPLGSKVEITFVDEKYHKYNGIYTALDVGGAIKNKKIDFFMGDFRQNETHDSVWEFGKSKARVKILND